MQRLPTELEMFAASELRRKQSGDWCDDASAGDVAGPELTEDEQIELDGEQAWNELMAERSGPP